MKLQDALKTNKYVARKSNQYGTNVKWCKSKTDKFKELVGCSYFIYIEDNEEHFSTSLDLYPGDIFADDWIIIEEKCHKCGTVWDGNNCDHE